MKKELESILREAVDSATLARKKEATEQGLVDPKADYNLTTSKDVEDQATWYRAGIRHLSRQIKIENMMGNSTEFLEQSLENEKAEFKQFKLFWNL